MCSMSQLDVDNLHHVRHIFYPRRVSNAKLYEMCSVTPLSEEISRQRWKLFGHVLRMPLTTPAQMVLNTAFSCTKKGRRGRPPTCLLKALQSDVMKYLNAPLRSSTDLNAIRRMANEKNNWLRVIVTHSDGNSSTFSDVYEIAFSIYIYIYVRRIEYI